MGSYNPDCELVVDVEERSPTAVSELLGTASRADDVGEQDCCYDTVRSRLGGHAASTSKPRSEERDVFLPIFLSDELAAHIGRYVEDDPDALVFTSAEGSPIRNSNFRRRVWTPALEAAGVEPLTMQEMRHTAASIMADEGWQLQAAKEQLGHSSILVTSDTYSHLSDESQDELAKRLDRDHTATNDG